MKIKKSKFFHLFISSFFLFGLTGITEVKALDIIPGLKGFGTDTRAAYGAINPPEICIVDSLLTTTGNPSWNSSGYSVGVFKGTLIQCLEGLNTLNGETIDGHIVKPNSGKIILFEVSGTINQNISPYNYTVDFPYTHIAGQTAPNPGIALRNVHFQMAASDSVLQHIKSRVGDAIAGYNPNDRRSITVQSTSSGGPINNVVVDHVTATWGIDTCFTVWEDSSNPITNVTVSNCFVGEGLHESLHPETAASGVGHSKGLALQVRSNNISAINNLIINNYDRNPYIRYGSKVLVNNYTYNNEITHMSVAAISGTIDLAAVGNVIESGPITHGWGDKGFVILYNYPEDSVDWDNSNVYLLDNKYNNYTQTNSLDWSTVFNQNADDVNPYKIIGETPSIHAPLWPNGLMPMSSSLVKTSVMTNAGSRPAQRDLVDNRLISDIINGTGVLIDSPSDVGGWPVLAENSITLAIPSNPHADNDSDGYTNLEEWLHCLACDVEGKVCPECSATPPADHNWYFSMSGGGDACSQEAPCKWLSSKQVGYIVGQTTAQNKIDSVASDKTVNLYFERGDVWSFDTDAVSTITNFGLLVNSSNPAVNIDAYGSGNKPVFDGRVIDFSVASVHNQTTGPLLWSHIFGFEKQNCSVKNIEIKQVYGHGVTIKNADGFILEGCSIHHFGTAGIAGNMTTIIDNITVRKNEFYVGQQLWRYSLRSGWGAAISLITADHQPNNNLVQYNTVYDIYGEGINAPNSIVEYNIVGDTASIGINTSSHRWDSAHTIVRYNLVTMSDWNTSIYDAMHGGGSSPTGIRVFDERDNGDNTSATIEIYGNTIINRSYGIRLYADRNEPFGLIKVYNNTIIDCHTANMRIANTDWVAVNAYIYNNSSIIYDQTGIDPYQGALASDFSTFTIEDNHAWIVGGLVVSDINSRFHTGLNIGDPKLSGEPLIDWDGQSGPTYYKDIKFSDIIPLAGSSLIGSGKTLGADFSKTFLTTGTDFSTLPNSPNFTLSSQTDGSWDVGAVEVGGTTVSTCLTEGYQCCSSCQSGPHSEYDSDCFGGICCETCSIPLPPTPDPTCADLGTCCPAGQLCSGIGKNLPGCENVCCTGGGTCVPASTVPLTCQSAGYKCCASCHAGPQSGYDSDCALGRVCCETCPPPPRVEIKNFIKAIDFSELVQNLLSITLSIVGALALLMLIFGGVMYVGSTGDEQRILTAKKIVTYAIIGLVLILGAYSIAMVLNKIMS